MARHDALSDAGESKIRELLIAGNSIHRTASAVGVCDKTVAVRRAKLKRQGLLDQHCQCGQSRHHSGTCKYRAHLRDHVPEERAYIPRETIHPTFAVHMRRAEQVPAPDEAAGWEEKERYVKAITPKSFPYFVQEDISQELFLRLIENKIPIHELYKQLPKVAQKIYQTNNSFALSLDYLESEDRGLARTLDVTKISNGYITSNEAIRLCIHPGFIEDAEVFT